MNLLDFFKPRERLLDLGDVQLVIRELPSAVDASAFKAGDDHIYPLIVRCTFAADGVTPAFTDDDIPALKKASRRKLARLMTAVVAVNALDPDDEVKNSNAGPSSG